MYMTSNQLQAWTPLQQFEPAGFEFDWEHGEVGEKIRQASNFRGSNLHVCTGTSVCSQRLPAVAVILM